MAIDLSQILELPIEERLKLIEAIWESIAERPELLPLTEEQKREIERRIEYMDRHPDEGTPWPEVKARILGQS